MADYGLVTPCPQCPFRTDVKPYIRAARAREILEGQGLFPCHKTVKVSDEGDEENWGDITDDTNAQVCAGFLICLEHDDEPNQMMRISERLGLYDRKKLRMDAPVYRGVKAAIRAHQRNR